MKATGIIRRIDDLGRVVIPKEIRRTLSIREGDPFEIVIHNDMVCYKKYTPETEYLNTIERMLINLTEDVDVTPDKKEVLILKIEEIIALLK